MTGGTRLRAQLRFLAALAVIACVGIAAAAYVLINQRAPNPFQDVYELKAEFEVADGVEPGLGQPVRVAGVKVGTISDLSLGPDNPTVTMRIERDQLPRVYKDATASLEPITPLEDMQLNLDPGRPSAAPLPEGATIRVERTRTPVPLSDLLSALDGDTRAFLRSFISATGVGTEGRGEDLREALLTLGPTAAQIERVSSAVASRRKQLAQLVHNLSGVTEAASSDGQLSELIVSAHATLAPLAESEDSLREAIQRAPGGLQVTADALEEAASLARELDPALAALTPAVAKIKPTLERFGPFAKTARTELAEALIPFVPTGTEAMNTLSPAMGKLRSQVSDINTTLKGSNYFLNELAYNPPGEKLGYPDEGFLFWLPWFTHNYNSLFSAKDAHGGIGRGMVMVNCQQLVGAPGLEEVFRLLVPTYSLCPRA